MTIKSHDQRTETNLSVIEQFIEVWDGFEVHSKGRMITTQMQLEILPFWRVIRRRELKYRLQFLESLIQHCKDEKRGWELERAQNGSA